MRCVVVISLFLLIYSSGYAATPEPKRVHEPTIEELNIEITRHPDSIEPKIELAKRLIAKGNRLGAHAYLTEVLNKTPNRDDAKRIMKDILLSDEPFLGNPISPSLETRFFKIPTIPKQYEFVKSVQIDSFGEKLREIVKDPITEEKILVILYDSDESFLAASSGKRRSFATTNPSIIGIDPNLDRDQFVEAFREALVELWVKTNMPARDLPRGVKSGLANSLSPILIKPANIRPITITDLIEGPPKNEEMLYVTTIFLKMLHELNPDGFSRWLKIFGSDTNPMNELLTTFHFTSWSDLHSTFKDYLKRTKG